MSVNNLNASSKPMTNNASFWDIGGYRANVQRIRDGYEHLDEVAKMLRERIDVEDRYAKSMQAWHQKWRSYSERGLPDGIIKSALEGVLGESKELARIHTSVKDRLAEEVVKTIGAFRESSYHRSAIRGLKEQKEIEDKFEKAQYRWKKLFKRLELAKKHYHACCRAEKSAYVQMINSQADLSVMAASAAAEGVNHAGYGGHGGSGEKSRERHEKCREETRKARLAYEQQLKDLSYENTAYVDKMCCVFEECQQFEFNRIKFLLEMISGIQKALVDLVAPPKLQQIHASLEERFHDWGDEQLRKDLAKWSARHGADVPHKMPVFESYTPELRSISSKRRDAKHRPHNGVILTKKKLLTSERDSHDGEENLRESDADFRHGYPHNYRALHQQHGGSVGNLSASATTPGEPAAMARGGGGGAPYPHHRLRNAASTQDVYRAGLGLGQPTTTTTTTTAKMGAVRAAAAAQHKEKPRAAASAGTATVGKTTQRFAAPAANQLPSYHVFVAEKYGVKDAENTPQIETHSLTSTLESNASKAPAAVAAVGEALVVDVVTDMVESPASSAEAQGFHTVEKHHLELKRSYDEQSVTSLTTKPLKASSINSAMSKVVEAARRNAANANHNANGTSGSLSSASSMAGSEGAKENRLPDLMTKTAASYGIGGNAISDAQSNGSAQRDVGGDTAVAANVGYRGETVRVLYDYVPNESDEIALVKGELVEMIRPADDMGWCLGRKNDKVGFFPGGYVARI